MRCCTVLLACLFPVVALAADDCDITLRPAATLLLPYFEVDFKSPAQSAAQTLFTIQNTSPLPQIAHVVLWTDWGFPALDFNLFLTGYDVQGINLYDIFANAVIAPGVGGGVGGTSSNTTVPISPTQGSQPAANNANPHIPSLAGCANLPGIFGKDFLVYLQQLFTTGFSPTGFTCNTTTPIGGRHDHAVGYATIDVISSCAFYLPTEAAYWKDVLYDNVLTGDYQQVVPRGNGITVQGGPLVHIRAVAEGTPLPHTFYERYTTTDRRQPLPSAFAPRFIAGGKDGFNTTLKIWREGIVPADAGCAAYRSNSTLSLPELVRFDEHENATAEGGSFTIPVPPTTIPVVLAASAASTAYLPPISTSGDVGGWIYVNAGTQSWVMTSMYAAAINGTDAAAAALANGCAPRVPRGAQIGPVP